MARFRLSLWGLAVGACLAGPLAAESPPEPPVMKPFVVPTLGVPAAPLDLRAVFTGPRGEDLPPVVVEDGHFVAGGKRVRFWGVNLCFGGCFPPHDVADRLAARLAAFGINCVRFHHMDNRAFPGGIWKKDSSGLDPEALDRLDYLLAAMKREGVYANLNLHVSRDFSATGSKATKDELPQFGKIVCIFDPELIELQKQYARDLLGHKNRYTGLRHAEDPVVAMVEITNENSAFLALSRFRSGGLAPRYEAMLAALWNNYLARRYGGDDALRKAWSTGALPRGREMLRATDLAAEAIGQAWQMEKISGTEMTAAAAEDGAVRLTVGKITDTSWHLQLKHSGLAVRKGEFYTVRLRARADGKRTIHVTLQQDREPWRGLGLSKPLALTDDWQDFEFGFTAEADDADAKLTFSVGQVTGDVWLARPSLAPGGRVGLAPDESLGKKNVRTLSRDDIVTEARAADFMRFLADLDMTYFTSMRDFLRRDLGVKAPVTGTEGFTLPSDWVQSHLDFVDGHAYWQHPRFPNRPWDGRDWTIPNTAMVDEPAGSTLLGLTFQRVAAPDGNLPPRPFTVTEYNHPSPNDYQAECIPMLASFAAAQDWDGVFMFAYSHAAAWETDAPRSFFDIQANPVKMVQMAAGALLFRREDIPAPSTAVVTYIPPEQLFTLAARHGPWSDSLMKAPEVDSPPHVRFFARHTVRFDLDWKRCGLQPAADSPGSFIIGGEGETIDLVPEKSEGPLWRSAGNVLAWFADGPKTGIFAAAGGRSAAVVGFAGGKPQAVGPAKVALESPRFAALTLSALDGRPLGESSRILITACARTENAGQEWNADRTSVADRWGRGPTLIEPVRATLTLKREGGAGAAKLLALGGDGKPMKELPVEAVADGALKIVLPGDPATLWYVLTIDNP